MIYLDYPVAQFGEDGGEGLPGKGPIPAEYAFVGIAPSTRRPADRRLEPFGAKSHKIIKGLLELYPSTYVTNLVKEPVAPGKHPTILQLRWWGSRLLDELRLVKPRRILALGDLPARFLCGPHFDSLREDRGTFFWSPTFECWVVPTYHFSAGARNPHLNRFINRDLERFFTLPDPDLSRTEYEVCPDDTDHFLGRILRLLKDETEVILDVETDGLGVWANLTQVGISWSGGPVFLFLRPTPILMTQLGEILRRKHCSIVGHNLQFDWGILLKTTNWKWPRMVAHDTMLLAHLRGEEVLALKHLVTLYTRRPGSRVGGGPGDPLYLAEDIAGTKEVYEQFKDSASAAIYPILQDLVPLVAAIKVRGVYIDRDALTNLRRDTVQQVAEAKARLDQVSGHPELNWRSSQQAGPVLLGAGVPLTAYTPTGALSTAEKHLLPHQESHPLVDALLKYRAVEKLLSGFIDGYLAFSERDSHLHPTLKLTGTDTGRLSCADPNLQQVNREGPLKSIFVPQTPGGLYGLVDLEQAELRIAALLSQDEALLEALLSEDTHRFIASLLLQKPMEQVTATERKASKKVTFGVLYGGSAQGLAEKAGLSVQSVMEILVMMNRQFAQLARWMKERQHHAIETGYIQTLFGRNRPVKEHLARGDESRVRRLAVNTPVQSLASDCMLTITRGVDRRVRAKRLTSRVLFGVHDSLLLSVGPGESDEVARLVQESFLDLQATPLKDLPIFTRLPLTGSFMTGESWAAVESTNDAYAPIASWECSSVATEFKPAVILHKELPEEDDEGEQSEDWDAAAD